MSADWPLFYERLHALGNALTILAVCLSAGIALVVGAFVFALGVTFGNLRLGLLGVVLIAGFGFFVMLFGRP